MHITIIQIGKTKHSFFQEAENEYLKRLQPYAKIKTITLKEAQLNSTINQTSSARQIIKEKEAVEILKHIPKDSLIITLDEKGQSMDSPKFAKFIQQKKDFEGGNVTFIIGGPYGLAQTIHQKSNLKLSFSAFTFTHEMIRTLLLEQLYRAFTIIGGKTYHY